MTGILLLTWTTALKDQRKLVRYLEDQATVAFERFKTQTAPGLDEVEKEYANCVHTLRLERKFLRTLEKKIARISPDFSEL